LRPARHGRRRSQALDKARCVIVCWSQASTHPQTGAKVQIEARVANDAGKLIQLKLEPADQPLFFRQFQAADLSQWRGGRDEPQFQLLAGAARAMVEGAGGARDFAAARPPARKRGKLGRAAIAALCALAFAVATLAAVALAPEGRLSICTLTHHDRLCLEEAELDAFDARLADARERLAQRAIFYIADQKQNFPSLAWAIAQLAAPNAQGLIDHKQAFDARMAALIEPNCGCLTYGPAPHTMSNAWMLVASTAFGEAAPGSIIDAILAAQSAEGWWSAALDALDQSDNGSTYATAFVILALVRQMPFNAERAAAMKRAAEAGSRYLIHQSATAQGFLSDYPQSLRKITNPGIDGQTLAALAVARPDVDLGDRARKISGSLKDLPPLWTTASSDVLIRRRNDAQYYDDFRHISAAWMVLGAVSGLGDLGPLERARVLSAVRRAFRRDLSSAQLFERDWVAAEAIFALGETVKRLRAMEERGVENAFAQPAG
jgi:hypothetical protein